MVDVGKRECGIVGVKFDSENHIYTVDGKVVPSVTQILDLLSYEEFGKIDKSTLDYASKRGTAIHEATESLDMGLEAEIDAETEPYVKAYMDFTRDYKPTWLGIEEMVYHPEFEFCGTIDRLGKIGNKFIVMDIKTVSSPDRLTYTKVCMQTFMYSLCLEDKYETYALFLKKDGTYRLFNCHEWWLKNREHGEFGTCVSLIKAYKTIKEIKNERKFIY